ncbi:unnamed protein product [Rotaria socialis]|uniref:Uncharacterized protein n=1 Tax=Rotaria socialis TaxID=392032 RepID=A0A820SZV5_9BILA|nr:unnamed protein product [Rotaria socialis]CAF3339702.1 unnamed protein product [Rotaria socialis]CAF3372979.1 unnamed protein product [Rotaria socialis]CAF3392736.1 unnamed protein product [Rotaria socialis]CAF3705287.1 unnamed protein product [Rotaria socialis]
MPQPFAKEYAELTLCIGFLILIASFIFGSIAFTYSEYHKSQYDGKTFTLETICHIDGIVSRPQEENSSSLIIINSTFLVSYEINENGNTTKHLFEEWSIPVSLQPNVVNSTYSCYLDPSNPRRRPLKLMPDIDAASRKFIWYELIPMIVLLLLSMLTGAILIYKCYIFILQIRPQCIFGVLTHPTNIT